MKSVGWADDRKPNKRCSTHVGIRSSPTTCRFTIRKALTISSRKSRYYLAYEVIIQTVTYTLIIYHFLRAYIRHIYAISC